MKDLLVIAATGLVVLALLFGLAFAVQGADFFLYSFFAPKKESVKREVFEQSKEYRHGTVQELDKMRLEWVRESDRTVRAIIESRALRMVAEFDKGSLPDDVRAWVYEIEERKAR